MDLVTYFICILGTPEDRKNDRAHLLTCILPDHGVPQPNAMISRHAHQVIQDIGKTELGSETGETMI